MGIGNKLKSVREEYGYSQESLAKKMDCSQKTISSWEKERTHPTLKNLHQLCEIYGCTYEYLTGVKQHDLNDITVNDILVKTESLTLQDLILLSEHINRLIHTRREIESIQYEKEALEKQLAEYNKKLEELKRK